MRLSNSKLVAATPIAALVLAASATAAPFQSRPATAVKAAPAKAAIDVPAEEADDGCACTCAKCLEKHGPKAAPAASVSRAKAPVRVEIMQSSDDAAAPEAARASDGPRVTTKRSWTIELAAPVEEVVVEEEPIIEEFEVSDHNETDTDQPTEAAEVDEVAELAREVEAILASELDVITEEAIAIAVAAPRAAQDSEDAAPQDERGFLGVALAVEDDGVAVAEVMDGSPAETSGLQAGDVLFRVGRRSITSLEELRDAMADTKPGQTIAVGFMRDGRPQRARVKLAKRETVVEPAGAARRAPTASEQVLIQPAPEAAEGPVDAAEPVAPRRGALRRRIAPRAPGGDGRFGLGGSRRTTDAAPRARDAAPRDGDAARRERDTAPRERDPAPANSGDRSPLRAAQAETDARVQAVMTGEDMRIVVMADGSVRVTGSNVRVERRAADGGTSVNSMSKLEVGFNSERAGALFSNWIGGARSERARGGDARAAESRGGAAQGSAARGRDANRDDAALRRRIREMSAEIDRLSRQIQRIGRALGDR